MLFELACPIQNAVIMAIDGGRWGAVVADARKLWRRAEGGLKSFGNSKEGKKNRTESVEFNAHPVCLIRLKLTLQLTQSRMSS
jgi:hypothetical protein